MIHRRRLTPSPRVEYRCFVHPSHESCPQCQLALETYEDNLQLLRYIAYSKLKDAELVDEYLHAFYVNKLTRKTHSFRVNDPRFHACQYMVRMLQNFILDERGRRMRHKLVEKFIPGLTRGEEEQTTGDIVATAALYRDEINWVMSLLSESDALTMTRLISPGWNLAEEAKRCGVQASAMRARINRIRVRIKHGYECASAA